MKFLEFLGKIWEKVWGLALGIMLAVGIRAIASPWIPFMGYPELIRLLGEHALNGLQLTGFAARELIFFSLFTLLYLYSGKIVTISLSRRNKVIATLLLLVALIGIAFYLYPNYSRGVAIKAAREAKEAAIKAKETADQLARGPKVFRDSQQKVADQEYREKEFRGHKQWSDDKASTNPEVREKASESKFWGRMKNIGDWFRDALTAIWLLVRWFFTSMFIRFLLVAMIIIFFLGKRIAWCKSVGFVLIGLIFIFTVLGFMGGGYKKESVSSSFASVMRQMPVIGGLFGPPPPRVPMAMKGWRAIEVPGRDFSAGEDLVIRVGVGKGRIKFSGPDECTEGDTLFDATWPVKKGYPLQLWVQGDAPVTLGYVPRKEAGRHGLVMHTL